MSKSSATIAIILAAVAGFFVGNITAGRGGEEPADPTATGAADGAAEDIFRVPVGNSPSKGPRDALVTIVEFSEFQWPYCAKVGPTLERIEREYRNKVRVVFKHNPLPFHKNAMGASEAAMAAEAQGKFWEMSKKLFENQRALERENLEQYAQQIGLDMNRFKADLDSHAHQRRIESDQRLAKQLGARGTPAFFINGRNIRGAVPFEQFKTIIDEEIQRAERVLKTGVPKARLYAELTKGGRTSAEEGPAGADAAEKAKREPRRREDPSAVYKVPIDGAPVKGPATALVTIVEFSDFQWPFCSRVRETLTQIERTYGTKVRMVHMQNPLPFHQNALPAAEAAMAANAQGKFWEMEDLLFQNMQSLDRPTFERLAQQIGLNMTRFKADLDNHAHKAAIERQQALAQKLGARGTPSFFINGRKLRGAQPFEGFKEIIDEEITKAQQAITRDRVPANRIYEHLTKNGREEVVYLDGAAGAEADAAEANRVYEIASNPRAPAHGPVGARVTILEFSDFQWPYCSRVGPTLKQIEETYGNRVRIEFRNYPLPFHRQAQLAAEAALEAHAQGKFWQYHDLVFANQRALERENLEQYAQQAGLNMTRFRAALDNHTHAAAIEADKNAIQRAGARIGTPTFFINGKMVSGALPFEQFKTAIDAALAAR